MPHLQGLGRLIACDLIGMGHSDKLSPSGPDRYHYAEHRDYLFALWEALDLGDNVILVIHDWGSVLGFDWANQHRDRVQGIAYMEAIVTPLRPSDFTAEAPAVDIFSATGEQMMLEQNLFVEAMLPAQILRELTDEEMTHYRRPFLNAGEDRRPTLSWPRNIPIGDWPADVVSVVNDTRPGSRPATFRSCSSTPNRAPSLTDAHSSSSAAGPTKPKSPSQESISFKRTVPTGSAKQSLISCGNYAPRHATRTQNALPAGRSSVPHQRRALPGAIS